MTSDVAGYVDKGIGVSIGIIEAKHIKIEVCMLEKFKKNSLLCNHLYYPQGVNINYF